MNAHFEAILICAKNDTHNAGKTIPAGKISLKHPSTMNFTRFKGIIGGGPGQAILVDPGKPVLIPSPQRQAKPQKLRAQKIERHKRVTKGATIASHPL